MEKTKNAWHVSFMTIHYFYSYNQKKYNQYVHITIHITKAESLWCIINMFIATNFSDVCACLYCYFTTLGCLYILLFCKLIRSLEVLINKDKINIKKTKTTLLLTLVSWEKSWEKRPSKKNHKVVIIAHINTHTHLLPYIQSRRKVSKKVNKLQKNWTIIMPSW